jgi:beta-galactosidase/beta-glucuronidase
MGLCLRHKDVMWCAMRHSEYGSNPRADETTEKIVRVERMKRYETRARVHET